VRSSRIVWLLGMVGLVAFGLLALSAGMASAEKPVITTPTPTAAWMPQPPTANDAGPFGSSAVTQPLTWTVELPSEVNTQPFTYTVQANDTLWNLAINFGRDLDTMSCATRPRGNDAASLLAGQIITIPGLSDLCYTVTPGDTLTGIAARYGLTADQIVAVAWNELPKGPPYNLVPRQRVLLPGARPLAPERPPREVIRGVISVPNDTWAKSPWPQWPYGDGHFVWPVVGSISQYARPGHRAIDIAVPEGTPIRAADRGEVIMAGWSQVGYGFRVVIDHHIDYITLYAHMKDIYVQEGQIVAKGQIIGVSGSNGNITGPHLHFEIRDFGILTDPLTLLPKH
jgi:murein DD-endopeptidase MepM/ murein hydrolase activator NlpD